MHSILLLTLAMSPTAPPSRLDVALLKAQEAAPECQLTVTQPLDARGGAQGGAVQLRSAEAAVEQIWSCGGDIGIIDYFDMGRNVEVGMQQLQRARWGGLQPPTRLHDGLLRQGSVLADVSGSRTITFLLQTKLQARDFHLLGGSADFDTISQAMAEDRAERAPPISGRLEPEPAGRAGGIEWRGYQDALREAASSHRPICLYFFTTWCPHCRNFERVLEDRRVVEQSRAFVMVKLNDEREPELARKYSPDGRYFPRLLFLSPDGELDPALTNGGVAHRYGVSESDPKLALWMMKRALGKLGR